MYFCCIDGIIPLCNLITCQKLSQISHRRIPPLICNTVNFVVANKHNCL